MVFALVVPLGVLVTWWAYHYERSVCSLVHQPRPGEWAAAAVARRPPVDRSSARRRQAPAPAATAVQQLERPAMHACTSVLGWDALTLASTLAADGQMLLSCCRPSGESGADELTMVVLIGDDERSERAIALLERWRAGRTVLGLRPTTVAGVIEMFDARHNALRVPLLVA